MARSIMANVLYLPNMPNLTNHMLIINITRLSVTNVLSVEIKSPFTVDTALLIVVGEERELIGASLIFPR